MGFSSEQLKMKFLIVCLVAAAYATPEAEAEADPALFYGGYGYPYAYGGYGLTYGLPAVHTVVKAAEADDAAVAEVKTVAAPAAVTYAHAAYPYAYYGHYGYAGHRYGYAGHYGYGHRYGYAGHYGYPYGYHGAVKKQKT